MKKNYTITIIGQNDLLSEDYVKTITYYNNYRFEAVRKAEELIPKLERMYKYVYIADVKEWDNYSEPPMGM